MEKKRAKSILVCRAPNRAEKSNAPEEKRMERKPAYFSPSLLILSFSFASTNPALSALGRSFMFSSISSKMRRKIKLGSQCVGAKKPNDKRNIGVSFKFFIVSFLFSPPPSSPILLVNRRIWTRANFLTPSQGLKFEQRKKEGECENLESFNFLRKFTGAII